MDQRNMSRDTNDCSTQPLMTSSKMVDFFDGRSVLLTGGSGFLGKVLIEKLLRSNPNINYVFVLMRPKRNKSAKSRLEEMLKLPLFRLHDLNCIRDKIVLVEGDVTEKNLGLCGEQLARVLREVSVVLHSAATVKFDERLKLAIKINVCGLKNCLDLARSMPQLAAFVHISTAYANCNLQAPQEHIYPTVDEPERLAELAGWMPADSLDCLQSKLLADRPNTYTYTKALSEWLLVKSARDLPIAVCRPSIVLASWQEPVPGWIDNINGPTGIVLGAIKGVIRSLYVKHDLNVDLVPVDSVVNMALSLAWFANEYHKTKTFLNCPQQQSQRQHTQTSAEQNIHLFDELKMSAGKLAQSAMASSDTEDSDDGYSSVASSAITASSCQQQQKGNEKCGKQHPQLIRSETIAQVLSERDEDEFIVNKKRKENKNIESESSIGKKMQVFRQKQLKVLNDKQLPSEIADIPVFHCTTGDKCPITWAQFEQHVYNSNRQIPSDSIYRQTTKIFTKHKSLYKFNHIFNHILPAMIIDHIFYLIGLKQIAMKMINKFEKSTQVLNFFVTNQWKFSTSNTDMLINSIMSQADKKVFDFDVKKINWSQYIHRYLIGIKVYLLNESMDNLNKALRNTRFVYYRNLFLQVLLISMLVIPLLASKQGIRLITHLSNKVLLV